MIAGYGFITLPYKICWHILLYISRATKHWLHLTAFDVGLQRHFAKKWFLGFVA
jgi:hypothetical protein